MRKFKIVVILSILISIGACKSKKLQFNILNLNKAQGVRNYATLYALPKTVIRVNIKVVRARFKRGPYYQYAKSLLGLTNVIEKDREKWKITGVEFETYAVTDTNHVYLIEPRDELSSIQLKLSESGLLESINVKPGQAGVPGANDFNQYKSKSTEFANVLSTDKLTDDDEISFDDVPLSKAIITKRAASNQASALASQILTLREDRSAILVGDGYTESMPDGTALKTMIEKIDNIMAKYLSMFTGKTQKDYFQYSFDFIPEDSRKITQAILFRFSEQFGVVDNTDMTGIPMVIEIESYENLRNYEKFKKRQEYLKRVANNKVTDKGLYYRISEMGIVKLIANDEVLKQEKIEIAQFGSIHSLPVKYLNGDYSIELYPELGALKSITKINKTVTKSKK